MSYEATTRSYDELSYGQVRVYPEWERKERMAGRLILPTIGLAAGGIVGYQTEFTYEDETFTGAENALLWGGVGLLAGLTANGFLTRGGRRGRAFDLSQSERWVRSFGRATGNEYVLRERELNETLVLVPLSVVEALRADYRALERDLRSSAPALSFGDLQGWERRIDREFSVLPADEQAHVRDLLQSYGPAVADRDLRAMSDRAAGLDDVHGSLGRLAATRTLSRELYARASENARAEFDRAIEDKTRAVLQEVVRSERARVGQADRSMAGIGQLNALRAEFDTKYGSYTRYSAVQDLLSHLQAVTAEITGAHLDRILADVRSAASEDRLDRFESTYLASLAPDAHPAPTVRRAIEDRRGALARQRAAAERAARERREVAQRQAQQRERVIAQRVSAVRELRQEVSQRHGTYLPSLENLFELLQLVPTMDRSTTGAERRAFVNRGERFGYVLSNPLGNPRELYADHNSFENGAGHTINTVRDGDGEYLTAGVILEVPGAPQDVVDLYAAELASEYRPIYASFADLSGEGRARPGNRYVKSGSTIYWYTVDEGSLRVFVRYNFTGEYSVVAERTSTTSVRVTSYSELTDISLSRGDVIRLTASGRVRLGGFVGARGPSGVAGYESFSRVRNLPHGSLIGRIGDGPWFLVGDAVTVRAEEDGQLRLRVNDRDVSNNDGEFDVTYAIQE